MIVLDRAPNGWWVSLEHMLDEHGRHVVVQRASAHLFPAPGEAHNLPEKARQ